LPEKLNSITPREQEVLRLISDGSTNREIANQLYIAEGTVKPYHPFAGAAQPEESRSTSHLCQLNI